MMVPEGLHSNSRRSLRPHAPKSKSGHHGNRESRRHAKRHAAPPADPALSDEPDILEQWLRHYGRHGKAYSDSASAPLEYQVMAAREVPSGESWHARIIYTTRTLTKWVRARTFVRTKGGTRDAKSSLESLQSLRFPADLRSTDPNKAVDIAPVERPLH